MSIARPKVHAIDIFLQICTKLEIIFGGFWILS